jgi:cytoskeletal protein CcmA (bactofilin family)
MAIFGRRAGISVPNGYSVVDEHLVIRGEIETDGAIRVDGRIEGREHRADIVIIGVTGVVVGSIEAREVIVAGTLDGDIVADGRVELQATARVRGDVRSRAMLLHEGASLAGQVLVDQLAAAAEAAPRLELSSERAMALPR